MIIRVISCSLCTCICELFSRFICNRACGYFPLTLHVEDIGAFHQNQAYGKQLSIFWTLPYNIICPLNDILSYYSVSLYLGEGR